MASKQLLLFEEITPATAGKIYKGGYTEIVLCTDGGDTDACRAICEYLLRHPKRLFVSGRCQSAGVMIAAAANETVLYPGVEWLHHRASSVCEGNRGDMMEWVKFLDRHDAWSSEFLEQRTGRPAADWTADSIAERTFTNVEALEWGLADREI